MSPLTRGNALLLVAIAGLALWLLWEPPAPPPDGSQALSQIDPAHVTRLQLLAPDGSLGIGLEYRDNRWQLNQPFAAPADPLSVTEILALARATSPRCFAAAALNASEAGLTPPRWQLSLDGQDFAIGDRESLSGRHYVRHAGRICLIGDLPLERLDLDYADLVSRQLIRDELALTAITTPANSLQDPATLSRWSKARALWLDRATREEHAAGGQPIEIQHETGAFHLIRLPDDAGLLRPDWDLVYRLPPSAYAELLPPDA